VSESGQGPPPDGDEPPSRCPEHLDAPTANACGNCGDARRDAERWRKDQARRAATARSAEARWRAEAVAAAIRRCPDCDERGYLSGGKACPHDPTVGNRARRGAAAARAALNKPAA
jgi:hypothetical protein